MKKSVFLIVAFISISAFAQQSINDYKYVVLPHKFDFMNSVDQYDLNTLTKKYLEQIGFTVFYNDEMPRAVANENCNKLYVNLNENNNMFWTRLTLSLKDCSGQILFKSDEGESRDKLSKTAYTQALRQVFGSLQKANYNHSGKEFTPDVIQNTKPVKPAEITFTAAEPVSENVLFAQPISNGFQLIDTTPKVIFKLQTTSKQDVFIAQRDSLMGVLININGNWIFEAYLEGKHIRENVNVKF